MRPFVNPRVPLVALLLVSATALGSQYAFDQAQAIIQPEVAKKLRRAGLRSTADFLTFGRTPQGRRVLADRAQCPIDQITGWVLLADLMRVPGIGPEAARLLTAVGVRSIVELRRSDPGATASAVREKNRKTHISENPPGAETIRYWVQLASSLPILISLD